MIIFKEKTELYVVTSFDEERDNITEGGCEIFEANEPYDADIIETDVADYVDLQFPNGDVAYSVKRTCFEIVPE